MKKIVAILSAIILLQAVTIILLVARIPGTRETGVVKQKPRAKIAFVFDDWGYNTRNVDLLYEIERPLTISVLPNLPFSKSIAEKVHKKGVEVMLHLPLEAKDRDYRPEKETIYTEMEEREVLDIFNRALKSIPHTKGVSNHMGSAATEDEKLMGVIFKKMKRRNLYFLDSLVTKKTICRQLARKIGLKFAERAVFLDNENDTGYIKGQIDELARIAKLRGSAIGIGHDRKLTLIAVKDKVAELEDSGIEFVYISELVK